MRPGAKVRGRPRVVVYLRGPEIDADYRIVHTGAGAGYQLQEQSESEPDGWEAVDPQHAFGVLASLLDPDDPPLYELICDPESE